MQFHILQKQEVFIFLVQKAPLWCGTDGIVPDLGNIEKSFLIHAFKGTVGSERCEVTRYLSVFFLRRIFCHHQQEKIHLHPDSDEI